MPDWLAWVIVLSLAIVGGLGAGLYWFLALFSKR
jgi:hypothetical protein